METTPFATGPQYVGERAPAELLDYSDYGRVRDYFLDRVRQAASTARPASNQQFTLSVTDVGYAPKRPTIKDEQEAYRSGKTLAVKLTGRYVLQDNQTGKVWRGNKRTLMNVPWMTSQGHYLINGVPYGFNHQFRMDPGIYVRRNEAGVAEAQFNVQQGTGVPFRVQLDPDSGVFGARLAGRNIPLYHLMTRMGVDENTLRDTWGSRLLELNKKKKPHSSATAWLNKAVDTERQRIAASENIPVEGISDAMALRSYFGRMQLGEENTARIMGKPYAHVSPEAVLHASQRVLDVAHSRADSDSRDNPSNQRVFDEGDHFATYFQLDRGGVMRQALWKLRNDPERLAKIKPGLFDQHVSHHLTNTGLSQVLEQINPLESMNQAHKLTRLGEGAIENLESAPDEARDVQPGYFNFIDSIRAPECYSADTDVMTWSGWKAWSDVTADDLLACRVDGKLQFHRPTHLVAKHYDGPMYVTESQTLSYCVTPNHRMYVAPIGLDTWRFETAEQMHTKNRRVLMSHEPFTPEHTETSVVVPVVEARNSGTETRGMPPIGAHTTKILQAIPMNVWARFLGYYLSEGCTCIDEGTSRFLVLISQSRDKNPDVYADILGLLRQFPFKFVERRDGLGFVCQAKQLAMYLRQFGKSPDKFVPPEIFTASVEDRLGFIDALLAGDGRLGRNGRWTLCTISRRLADDFVRLLFSVGRAGTLSFEPDKSGQASTGGTWVVYVSSRRVRTSYAKNARHPEGQQRVIDYSGMVYCAEVPGGLLFVRRGKTSGFWCGNSLRIGLDMYIARTAVKGPDNRLYARFRDNKTGQVVWRNPVQMEGEFVGDPGTHASPDEFVPAMSPRHGVQWLPKTKVRYELLSGDDLFSASSDSIPLKSGVKGMRQLMGSKFLSAAVPLAAGEAPLVQTVAADGKASADYLGRFAGSVRSPVNGVVTKVTPTGAVVRAEDGTEHESEWYEWVPFARKTHLEQTPVVKPGDVVTEGSPLARSNYTDEQGQLAIGRNLRVAYMPYRGRNFEDAVVISRSAAEKLASRHMYKHEVEKDETRDISRQRFVGLFPSVYTKDQLANIDPTGVVKVGATVNNGDPLVLAVGAMAPGKATMGRRVHSDKSETWEYEAPGVVRAVVPVKNGVRVFVEAVQPIQLADKLALPFGAKGTVAEIVEDDEMVKDSEGRPIDIIMSPLGVPSRTNPAQLVAAALGKVAEKTGKPYILPGYLDEDMVEFTNRELAANQLSDKETVYDPRVDKNIPEVFVGKTYVYKMQQMAEDKGKARDIGGYSVDEDPGRGSGAGGKHIGDMEYAALLSHGAKEVLKDLKTVHGQANPDFWRQVKLGGTPSAPRTPFVYDKFRALVRASGVNLKEEPDGDSIFAATNKDIAQLTGNRKLTSHETYDAKMRPVKGGLFDPDLGGGAGDRFAYIALPEPVLNPLMEQPVRYLLGLTGQQFDDLAAGRTEYAGKRGGAALKLMLERTDLDTVIANAKETLKNNSSPSRRDAAAKQLIHAQAIQDKGVSLADFMMDRVPVLPAKFRRVVEQGDRIVVPDLNYLYRRLMFASQDLQDARDLGPEAEADARAAVVQAYREVVGTEQPQDKELQAKRVGGVLKQLFSYGSPKSSFVQRKVLGFNIDLAGLGAVIPNPELRLNQVGIPEDYAWKVFGPFTIRRMVEQGRQAGEAARAWQDRSPAAKVALHQVMKERPVLLNRAPTLHKYSIMALEAVPVAGKAIQANPQIAGPFGLDHDGDLMSFTVPVSRAAVQEAWGKMVPERNLISVRHGKPHYLPTQEIHEGMYLMSKSPKAGRTPKVFGSVAEMKAAWRKGEIEIDDPVQIREV